MAAASFSGSLGDEARCSADGCVVTVDVASSSSEEDCVPLKTEPLGQRLPVLSTAPTSTPEFVPVPPVPSPAPEDAAAAVAAIGTRSTRAAAAATAAAAAASSSTLPPVLSSSSTTSSSSSSGRSDWLSTLAAARSSAAAKRRLSSSSLKGVGVAVGVALGALKRRLQPTKTAAAQTDSAGPRKRKAKPAAAAAATTAANASPSATTSTVQSEGEEGHVQLLQARPPEESGLRPLRPRAKRQRLRAAVPSLAFVEEAEEPPLPAADPSGVDVFMTTTGLAPSSRGSTTVRTSVEEMMAYVPVTYVPDVLPISFADHLLRVFLEETKAWHTSKRWLYDRELESHRLESGFRFDDAKGFGPRWERAGFGDDLRHLRSRLATAVREARGKLATSEGGSSAAAVAPSRFEQAQQVVARASRGQPLRGESAEWLVRYAQDCTQHGWRWEPNYAVANFYEDAEDFLGAHSDPVQSIGPWAIVASLTFGAARQFRMKPVGTLKRRGPDGRPCGERITSFSIRLPHNSLLVCWEGFQEFWRHEVPKDAGLHPHPLAGNGRLNFTFRRTSMAVPRRRPMCHCGRKTMLKPVLKETSRHKGRYFWSCTNPRLKKGQYSSCDFFQWDDERLMEMRVCGQAQKPPAAAPSTVGAAAAFLGAPPSGIPTPQQEGRYGRTAAATATVAASSSSSASASASAAAATSSAAAAAAAAQAAAALAAEDFAAADAGQAPPPLARAPLGPPPTLTPTGTWTGPEVVRAVASSIQRPPLQTHPPSVRPLAPPQLPETPFAKGKFKGSSGGGSKGRGKGISKGAVGGKGRGQGGRGGRGGGPEKGRGRGCASKGGLAGILPGAEQVVPSVLFEGTSSSSCSSAAKAEAAKRSALSLRPPTPSTPQPSSGGLLQRLLSSNAKPQPETIDLL